MAVDAAYQKEHTDDNGHGTHIAGIIGAAGSRASGVLPRKPWSHLSDHAPLVAEIHL